jgi:hypothetical protein
LNDSLAKENLIEIVLKNEEDLKIKLNLCLEQNDVNNIFILLLLIKLDYKNFKILDIKRSNKIITR